MQNKKGFMLGAWSLSIFDAFADAGMFLSLPAFLTYPVGDSLSRQAVGSFVIINTGVALDLKNS
jgi:hypothetical protein